MVAFRGTGGACSALKIIPFRGQLSWLASRPVPRVNGACHGQNFKYWLMDSVECQASPSCRPPGLTGAPRSVH